MRQLFLEHLAQTSDFPLAFEIEKAEGCYLIDPQGKKYLDLISGIAVSNLGHGNEKIRRAIIQQVEKHAHLLVYGELVQAPQVQLAAKLASVLPPALQSVYLVNSGAEATEGAMKLAKRYTGRYEIACFENAYHGSTQGALSLIGGDAMKNGFMPLLPGITRLRFNREEDLELITTATAAVFTEPIQGEAGIRPGTDSFLKALRRRCDETGTLLVFDEIQSGYGRTGKLFAFEHSGVVPDILLLAKGMGGGMPLGAFISSVEIMRCLRNNPVLGHITTFGGHPVSCAASLAALEELLSGSLIAEAAEKEKLFREGLQHPRIKEIRGKGLMLAAELDSFATVQKVIQRCLDKGLLTDWFLFCDYSLRIAPPLTISREEIEWACGVIKESLGD